MRTNIIDRDNTQSAETIEVGRSGFRALEPRPGRGRTIAIIALFVGVGFAISVAAALLSGSSPYGLIIAPLAIILGIPGIALAIRAIPQGIALGREFALTRRWWHLPWFCIFFSMLVWRIRDVGAASQNPIDGYAMLRILPEGFAAATLIIRLILRKPNWLGSLFRGIPGAMAVY